MSAAIPSTFADALAPLLDPAARTALADLAQRFETPVQLVQELLRRGWLTAYQAKIALDGKADSLLFANYVILNQVGEGGMGRVYKARQRNLGRIVALKVLRRECLANTKMVKRFRREIEILGSLTPSPHIVRAIDSDLFDEQYFIAMEYIEGHDLARRVKRHGPLPVVHAVDYARQAALGLQHAHEAGLVHRDVKPANLLVAHGGGGRGVVKILDMGLARWTEAEGNLTVMGSLMGTPDFLAPEQARNPIGCDHRADLYALGCTLYYLITGRIPFPRGGVTERLLQHATAYAEPMAAIRCQRLKDDARRSGRKLDEEELAVPAEVEALVRRLMAKHPDDRYATSADAARAIAAVLARIDDDEALSRTPAPDVTLTTPLLTGLPPIWQAIVETSGPQRIVRVEKRSRPSLRTRWPLVAVMTALTLAAITFFKSIR
jgi:eukaryotic-like serine/threonine-protein kinase